jgi:hypothetical protein
VRQDQERPLRAVAFEARDEVLAAGRELGDLEGDALGLEAGLAEGDGTGLVAGFEVSASTSASSRLRAAMAAAS